MSKEKIEFLYLSEPDMIEAGVLDMKECINVMEEVFTLMSENDYLMGGPKGSSHGMKLWYPKEKRGRNMPVAGDDRRAMTMIAYVGGEYDVCGNKWYGSNVANRERGLPRSIHSITLNDPETGAPLAMCSGNLVSAMRTGAVPGLATRYLKSDSASVVGIIGAGVINRAALIAICESLGNVELVKIYNRTASKAEALCRELSEETGIRMTAVPSAEEAIRESDVISVATSGGTPVIIEDGWIKKGALINLVGTASLSEDMYINSRVVVDNWNMHLDWIDDGMRHPDGIESLMASAPAAPLMKLYLEKKKDNADIVSLGDIITRRAAGRQRSEETIIFIAGGIPAEDVAWAHTVYGRALEKGIGQKLLLWEKPHWA